MWLEPIDYIELIQILDDCSPRGEVEKMRFLKLRAKLRQALKAQSHYERDMAARRRDLALQAAMDYAGSEAT